KAKKISEVCAELRSTQTRPVLTILLTIVLNIKRIGQQRLEVIIGAEISKAKRDRYKQEACSTCPDICEHSTKSFSAAAAAYSVAFRSYETAEQATYDESSIKYAISRTRTECSDVNDETNSGVSFKTEPYGPPSSPESANEIKPACSAEDCAGCGRLIQDRFYLSAVDKRWHVNCLQCYACRQPLDRESSCYSRDALSFFTGNQCNTVKAQDFRPWDNMRPVSSYHRGGNISAAIKTQAFAKKMLYRLSGYGNANK
uniref:LIM zinc-binding domain-containing protein n=1 Tax=Glossina austeni TaxID=7395 RepID=A0A1A9V9A4_GLOAU